VTLRALGQRQGNVTGTGADTDTRREHETMKMPIVLETRDILATLGVWE